MSEKKNTFLLEQEKLRHRNVSQFFNMGAVLALQKKLKQREDEYIEKMMDGIKTSKKKFYDFQEKIESEKKESNKFVQALKYVSIAGGILFGVNYLVGKLKNRQAEQQGEVVEQENHQDVDDSFSKIFDGISGQFDNQFDKLRKKINTSLTNDSFPKQLFSNFDKFADILAKRFFSNIVHSNFVYVFGLLKRVPSRYIFVSRGVWEMVSNDESIKFNEEAKLVNNKRFVTLRYKGSDALDQALTISNDIIEKTQNKKDQASRNKLELYKIIKFFSDTNGEDAIKGKLSKRTMVDLTQDYRFIIKHSAISDSNYWLKWGGHFLYKEDDNFIESKEVLDGVNLYKVDSSSSNYQFLNDIVTRFNEKREVIKGNEYLNGAYNKMLKLIDKYQIKTESVKVQGGLMGGSVEMETNTSRSKNWTLNSFLSVMQMASILAEWELYQEVQSVEWMRGVMQDYFTKQKVDNLNEQLADNIKKRRQRVDWFDVEYGKGRLTIDQYLQDVSKKYEKELIDENVFVDLRDDIKILIRETQKSLSYGEIGNLVQEFNDKLLKELNGGGQNNVLFVDNRDLKRNLTNVKKPFDWNQQIDGKQIDYQWISDIKPLSSLEIKGANLKQNSFGEQVVFNYNYDKDYEYESRYDEVEQIPVTYDGSNWVGLREYYNTLYFKNQRFGVVKYPQERYKEYVGYFGEGKPYQVNRDDYFYLNQYFRVPNTDNDGFYLIRPKNIGWKRKITYETVDENDGKVYSEEAWVWLLKGTNDTWRHPTYTQPIENSKRESVRNVASMYKGEYDLEQLENTYNLPAGMNISDYAAIAKNELLQRVRERQEILDDISSMGRSGKDASGDGVILTVHREL